MNNNTPKGPKQGDFNNYKKSKPQATKESTTNSNKQEDKVLKRVEWLFDNLTEQFSDKFLEFNKQASDDFLKESNEKLLSEVRDNLNELENQIFGLRESIDNANNRLSNIKIDTIKTRFMRWLGIICVSAICASVSSYYMMKQFPLRLSLSHNKEININNSKVSIWGSKGTSINKDSALIKNSSINKE